MKSLIVLWVLVVGSCLAWTFYGDVLIAGFEKQPQQARTLSLNDFCRQEGLIIHSGKGDVCKGLSVGDWGGELEPYDPQQAGINRGETYNPQESNIDILNK